MSRRLLFVHAPPDAEASEGAATAARYVDEGAEVVLVTCTGGEAGEVLNPSAEAVTPEQMGSIRAAELAAAVDAIGFTRTYGLGHRDSGWHEDLDAVPAGTFWHVPIEQAAAELAGILRHERTQVVVTYPEDGGYPHPDHIRTHDVTVRALELAADPDADLGDVLGAGDPPWTVSKLYASEIFPLERLRALHDGLVARGIDDERTERLRERLEKAEDKPAPDALVEVGAWLERRDAALRAHVTQVDPEGPWFHVPRELERGVYPWEAFLRLRLNGIADLDVDAGGTGTAAEDDLFTGVAEPEHDTTAS